MKTGFFKTLLMGIVLISSAYGVEESPLKKQRNVSAAAAPVSRQADVSFFEEPQHLDIIQNLLSFTDPYDVKSLIHVSKRFNDMLLGKEEGNSIIWQRWAQKVGIEVLSDQSARDAVRGHFCLVNANAAKALRDSPVKWIEEAISYGSKAPLHLKIEGYRLQVYGYPEDQRQAFALNESLVEAGDIWAIERKMLGYEYGRYGYSRDPQRAHDLNEALTQAGDSWAYKRRIVAYDRAQYGYGRSSRESFSLNEALFAVTGDRWAIVRRIVGYGKGRYGYPQDLQMAAALIKKHLLPLSVTVDKYLNEQGQVPWF